MVEQKLYGFTVKINNKTAPTHEDYTPILAKMSKFVDIQDFVYEDKKKDGKTSTKLHIHGVFKCKRHPYFESVIPSGSGVKIDVEPIYDMSGWVRYCNKNVAKSEGKIKEYPEFKPIDEPVIDNRVYMF